MVVFRDDWRQKTYCKRALGLCTVLYIDRTFALHTVPVYALIMALPSHWPRTMPRLVILFTFRISPKSHCGQTTL